jgi:hypothetical protein
MQTEFPTLLFFFLSPSGGNFVAKRLCQSKPEAFELLLLLEAFELLLLLLLVSWPDLRIVAEMSRRLRCCQVEAKSAVPRSQQHGGNNAQGGAGGMAGKGSGEISRELAAQRNTRKAHRSIDKCLLLPKVSGNFPVPVLHANARCGILTDDGDRLH